MSIPTISDLYSFYDILCGATSTPDEKEAAYKSVLLGTKGGEKEKRLACQFIARFSKQFDHLREESFNCILDVCDDDDPNIRKQAIHDLFQFCKRLPSFIPRVADVFVQMFQTDDTSEFHLLSMSLSQMLHLDPKPTLVGIFNQLLTVNPENPREHILKFLVERLKSLSVDKMTADVEDFITEQANKVLRDVSEEEFPLLINILSSLKCMSTVPGRQKLVGMITDQALQACPDFNATDPACVAQIRESGRQAALCVSKNVHARDLYVYLLGKVIPKVIEIPDSLNEDRLVLMRVTADLSTSHGTDLSTCSGDEINQYLMSAFHALLQFLPDIPDTVQPLEVTDSQDTNPRKKLSTVNNVNFPELECLLCICCQLGKAKPDFFGGYTSETERNTPSVELGISRLRMLRPRLQYLSRLAQEYSQSLAGALNSNGQADETKTKVISHRLAINIQTLIRSFFHNPPLFKHVVVPSWSQPAPIVTSPGSKRPAVAVESPKPLANQSTKSRREQPRYVPPVGQWSHATQLTRRNTDSKNNRRNFRGRNRIW